MGNGKKQKSYGVKTSWEALGGSPETAAFLEETDEASRAQKAQMLFPRDIS